MTRLQEDLLEVYNNLVELSETVLEPNPCPVKVFYDSGMGCLGFKVASKGLYLRPLNYYIPRPDLIPDTWLLPEDYDELLGGLSRLIKSGALLGDRVCVSPEMYGFDVYQADTRNLTKGVQILGSFRFISGTSWWFRWRTAKKYRNVL